VHTAAEVLDEHPDGVWLADLAAVSDPDAVATQVGQIFALKEGPGTTATDAVAAYLAEKRALLILDNCEHVLDAASALSDRLGSSCSRLHILATSRQPLDLPGEVAWRVPSLAVPEDHGRVDDGPTGIAGLAACEAVQLFVDRAGRARPGFALTDANSSAVAEICRHLDGIPLAIELAAARVRVFTPAQIAAGLDQRFALLTGAPRTALPRQQTLEASVDWSHDLLTDLEQTVFRRLSVFAGSFDYDAAVAVCAAPPIAPHQVLDQLSLLVDKSLVLVDDSGQQARYRLLETVRDYAARRLAETDEETPPAPPIATTTWRSPRRRNRTSKALARPNGWHWSPPTTPTCAPPWPGAAPAVTTRRWLDCRLRWWCSGISTVRARRGRGGLTQH
jgi:predicted ATPase